MIDFSIGLGPCASFSLMISLLARLSRARPSLGSRLQRPSLALKSNSHDLLSCEKGGLSGPLGRCTWPDIFTCHIHTTSHCIQATSPCKCACPSASMPFPALPGALDSSPCANQPLLKVDLGAHHMPGSLQKPTRPGAQAIQ